MQAARCRRFLQLQSVWPLRASIHWSQSAVVFTSALGKSLFFFILLLSVQAFLFFWPSIWLASLSKYHHVVHWDYLYYWEMHIGVHTLAPVYVWMCRTSPWEYCRESESHAWCMDSSCFVSFCQTDCSGPAKITLSLPENSRGCYQKPHQVWRFNVIFVHFFSF